MRLTDVFGSSSRYPALLGVFEVGGADAEVSYDGAGASDLTVAVHPVREHGREGSTDLLELGGRP